MTAFLLSLSSPAHEAVPLSITLDGQPATAWAWNVGPGELLLPIDRIPIFVGEGRNLVIRTEKGRVFIGDRLAGLSIGPKDEPFAGLADGDLRDLRGLLLDQWNDRIAARVASLDVHRTALALRSLKSLPPLPPALRWLDLKNTSNADARDFSGLAGLTSLRYLRVDTLRSGDFDCAWIASCTSLRLLDLTMEHLVNPSRLASLTQLHSLLLGWGEGLTDLAVIKSMTSLKSLDVARSRVADGSALAGHPSIESVNADMTPLAVLPDGPLPSLRSLRVMSTNLAPAAIDAFSRANPGCRVIHRWDAAFAAETRDADRLRVRSGGTCHRKVDKEQTLFEEKDLAAVRRLLATIAVDEPQSGFHCMCCGEPSIEIYRGATLLATLAVHHGRSLRWSGWPGDAMLTDGCSDAVNAWLAANGVTGPSAELEASRVTERASRRRTERSRAILGAAAFDAMIAAKSPDATQKAFESAWPDAAQRATIALRLFGCDETSWSNYAVFDEWLQSRALPAFAPAQLAACLSGGDEGCVRGAARWFFGEKKLAALDAARFGDLARLALSHPRPESRRGALEAIALLDDNRAVAVLRELLAGTLRPRVLPEDERAEPGGMRRFTPQKLPPASEQALAAHLLAKAGDTASLPTVLQLVALSRGPEKAVLEAAAKKLQ
jgi:hypothetical protein